MIWATSAFLVVGLGDPCRFRQISVHVADESDWTAETSFPNRSRDCVIARGIIGGVVVSRGIPDPEIVYVTRNNIVASDAANDDGFVTTRFQALRIFSQTGRTFFVGVAGNRLSVESADDKVPVIRGMVGGDHDAIWGVRR